MRVALELSSRGFNQLKRKPLDEFLQGNYLCMPLVHQTILLFALNILDAVLTIYWVRNGFATEGNQLMATLLDIGDLPFLAVKVAIGAITAIVLWRWRNLRLAKYGLIVALAIYIGLMGVHFFTGLSAFGYVSNTFVSDFTVWSSSLLA
jgi:uncharacterized membrane protein